MNNNQKIVTQIPMPNLWSNEGIIEAKRGDYLSTEQIQELLKHHPIQFVIANVGDKLKWVDIQNSYNFWKEEVKPHLAQETYMIDLECYPNNYAYLASIWTQENSNPIILLETIH